MLENLKKYKIILASGSPRRRELLAALGIDFEVRLMDGIDEFYPMGLSEEEIPQYISRRKAEAYVNMLAPEELLITADTIVWLKGEVLGKPYDDDGARKMLHQLAGRTHHVITGVTLCTTKMRKTFCAVSEVTFDELSEEEIDFYVSKWHPNDKAGAYGIQEWIGYVGVSSIKGSYFNVMGLPVQRLYKELKKL